MDQAVQNPVSWLCPLLPTSTHSLKPPLVGIFFQLSDSTMSLLLGRTCWTRQDCQEGAEDTDRSDAHKQRGCLVGCPNTESPDERSRCAADSFSPPAQVGSEAAGRARRRAGRAARQRRLIASGEVIRITKPAARQSALRRACLPPIMPWRV